MLPGLPAKFGFHIFSTDITQTYPDRVESLQCNIFAKACNEFELGPDTLIKLLKPLYGLAETGVY